MSMRALRSLVLLALLAPLAHASVGGESVHVFATSGAVLLDVSYEDGLGSTKFGFTQLAGQGGGPTQRLEATATCTEWRGTFTQVLVLARDEDRAANATLAILGDVGTPLAGAPQRHEPGFAFDAMGAPGAFEGTLLVCDDPEGPGIVRFFASVRPTPFARADPALVRITEG